MKARGPWRRTSEAGRRYAMFFLFELLGYLRSLWSGSQPPELFSLDSEDSSGRVVTSVNRRAFMRMAIPRPAVLEWTIRVPGGRNERTFVEEPKMMELVVLAKTKMVPEMGMRARTQGNRRRWDQR